VLQTQINAFSNHDGSYRAEWLIDETAGTITVTAKAKTKGKNKHRQIRQSLNSVDFVQDGLVLASTRSPAWSAVTSLSVRVSLVRFHSTRLTQGL
jgi:hypothetical protein